MGKLQRLAVLLMLCVVGTQSQAQDATAFRNALKEKGLTMILATNVGGGTDATGRLVAQFLTKHLPGNPNIITRNMGAAGGITAMNFATHQAVPDGTTVIFGSNGVQDPFNYRTSQANYNPANFKYIGGVGRGGQFLVISKDALPRLHDKTKPPVIMGSQGSSAPRSGMQVTAWAIEYLGWNAKWVTGYPGTNDLILALQRGEIDMTATANFFLVDEIVRTGKFHVVMQSGTLVDGKVMPRPEFADAPVFAAAMKDKIKDPVAKQAFDYYIAINTMDKWVGMPPGTPPDVMNVYREAFSKIRRDQEFIERGAKISEDFTVMPYQDIEGLVQKLASTTPEAVKYINTILRKQGLQINE